MAAHIAHEGVVWCFCTSETQSDWLQFSLEPIRLHFTVQKTSVSVLCHMKQQRLQSLELKKLGFQCL